ncbi:NAD-dependent epimerase/dehydratase family protein [Frigidibacter sp. RF13]|uniref:NAD-dependent epimerase/dehydratase family protein n=1 Tax=Frigidibacter sp. RF13 TaxID=2997340 RepID=UPI002270B7C3|nr:NAD-dependent epimerase/dehydratase family protein [Frigidibacter sp. RF13]MCY1127611.1 NAD-dependent epimerase/dehydratase family protein [Frigidibacter sp. RF13]
MSAHDLIFVTGASGFLAKHIVLKLLGAGCAVRGSVRGERQAQAVRDAVLSLAGEAAASRLSFATLDLLKDEGWAEAMQECDALIHTASPFVITERDNPDALIRPAVDGTLRALMAARAAGIERVVLTSSVVAVQGAISPDRSDPYTEADWSDPDDPRLDLYARSKTLAERAAWDYAAQYGLQLTAINPGWILGRPLDRDFGTSVNLVARVLRGKDPMLPRLSFSVVDVEDVAEAHVRALRIPEAIGERIIVTTEGSLWFPDWGRALKERWPERRIATRTAPRFLLKLLSLFDREIRAALPRLDAPMTSSNEKARRLLGLEFTDARTALLKSAEFLIEEGLA